MKYVLLILSKINRFEQLRKSERNIFGSIVIIVNKSKIGYLITVFINISINLTFNKAVRSSDTQRSIDVHRELFSIA